MVSIGMVVGRVCGVASAMVLAVFGITTDVRASDFYHECGLPGGEYRMLDEVLFTGTGENEKEVRYTPINKVVISETEGYCVGKTGNRYGFSSQRYLQRVEIRTNGEPLKLDFYCELASDGLPANEECTKQVKTKVKRLVPAYETKLVTVPGAPSGE